MCNNTPCQIIDSTLRDGAQAAGVHFTRAERIDIAQALADTGIRLIEGGIPAAGEGPAADFLAVLRAVPRIDCIAWCRARVEDLEASLRAGARFTHFSIPASDRMLEGKLQWTRKEALETTARILDVSQSYGLVTSVGAEDASRADQSFITELFECAVDHGAARLRWADTLGICDPFQVTERMSYLVNRFGSLIEFHGHNDLGFASANSYAALRVGACTSVTVGGLGERSGNAALEQVAAQVAILGAEETGIKLEALPALCTLVSEASGRPIPPDRPISGERSFCHESGIHVDALLKDRDLYTGVDPRLFAREHEFLPGPDAGRGAIRYYAKTIGIDIDDDTAARIKEKFYYRTIIGGKNADPWSIFAEILREGA